MPEQSHPPYVDGALVIPRQLERWLDINPQNGPLERTKRTFTIPAFNFEVPRNVIVFPYNGVNVRPCLIGGVFNYTASNVFSLKVKGTTNIVGQSTYTLVIGSKNSDGTLTRYILWQGNPIVPLEISVYSGQPINAIFRIEVWYTRNTPIQLIGTAQILITSKLGDLDYRYGVDSSLETLQSSFTDNDASIDAFGIALPANLPLVMPVNTYI